jgi:hypothetical protein
MSDNNILRLHFWALPSRTARRFRAHHQPPAGVADSPNLEDDEPKPISIGDGSSYKFIADASYHKAIWPVALDGDDRPTPQDWMFLFWTIHGIKGGPRRSDQRKFQIDLEIDGSATEIEAIAWYGTYGTGHGANGVWIDAFDLKANRPIDEDFVTIAPKELAATASANETGLVSTEWTLSSPPPLPLACSIEAFAAIQSLMFMEWDLPSIAGDIKILWGPDGKPVEDSAGKAIPDLSALAVAPGARDHLIAKQHVQGFAFAFYRPPFEHDRPVVDVITKPGPIDYGRIAKWLGDLSRFGFQGIASLLQNRFSELDKARKRVPDMVGHEPHQWLANIRATLVRLSEVENSLVAYLKDRGK